MKTFTLFPNLKIKDNPYIQDFIDALNRQDGAAVVNSAHKNPLLSILPRKQWGNVFVFNWFESIPDFKYGPLQSVIATVFLVLLKLCGRKIVWILHNKQPHQQRYGVMKRFLAHLIARHAHLIVTHSKEGIELVRRRYPHAVSKVHFFHHPTKDRLGNIDHGKDKKVFDLLIWGAITRYKGVVEFVDYLRQHPEEPLRVCIIGKCSPAALHDELTRTLPHNVTLIHEKASFEKLGEYIRQAHFVLMPYFSRSILSSGILMDSLSFGAKVIGPHTGAFKDCSQEPLLHVLTFRSFSDILPIVTAHKATPANLDRYRTFLIANNWDSFTRKFLQLIDNISTTSTTNNPQP